jgi:opacity protein-like surface antigen
MVSIWTASGIPQAAALEKDDVYMSFYILGSFPRNQNVNFGGVDVPNTSVENGIGAGLKVGVFPDITRRLLGFEFEYSALGSGIEFPVSTGSGTESIGSTNLLVFGSMVNLIIRYPGKVIQPYVGIGGGLSHGILFGADIPGRADRDFEASPTFGYQFLAGVQSNLTEKTYLFGEYKRFAANYHWEGLSLDFRAQYALVGIGIRF